MSQPKTDTKQPNFIDFGPHQAQEHKDAPKKQKFNFNDKDEAAVQIFFNSNYKGHEAYWFCNDYHLHNNGLYMPRTIQVGHVNTPLRQIKQWASHTRDRLRNTTTGKANRWTRTNQWPLRFMKTMPTAHGWKVYIVLYIQLIDNMPGSIREDEIDEVLRAGKV